MLNNESGLTLIELCMTMLILGLILMASTPKLARSFKSLRSRNAAEDVAADLVLCQYRAILSGSARRIRVWENGLGYTIERLTTEQENGHVLQLPETWQVESDKPLANGATLRPSGLTVECLPSGARSAGIMLLTDAQNRVYEIRFEKGSAAVQEVENAEE